MSQFVTSFYDALMFFDDLKVRESLREQLVTTKYKTWREQQDLQYDHIVGKGK